MKLKQRIKKYRKWLLLSCIVVIAVATGVVVFAADSSVKIGLVNFQGVSGDVQANGDKMLAWIEQAADEELEILVFPELAATYGVYEDLETQTGLFELWQNYEQEIARLAEYHKMWIIYGAPELSEDGIYNAVYACAPDGSVVSTYQLLPAAGEAFVLGDTPLILDTKWGLVGIIVGNDLRAPEIGRYYTAKGCRMVINPTAAFNESIDEWQWYHLNQLENVADREGIFIASAALTSGAEVWPYGGSAVVGPTNSNILTGITEEPYIEYYIGAIDNQTEGLQWGNVNLSKYTPVDITGFFKSNFQPNLYAQWYTELAEDMVVNETALPEQSQVKIGTVDFQAVWNDKEANLTQMEQYLQEAVVAEVNILVFPELALSGYARTNFSFESKHKQMVNNAITVDSPEVQSVSAWAVEHNMYILFGAPQKIPNDTKQAYNSTFICLPDGNVEVYQKIHNVEGTWSSTGDSPLIIDTEYGAMGISICKDTYAYPELQRYYAAKGCTFVVNPTATGPHRDGEYWVSYYLNRLDGMVSRDHTIMISANLGGEQSGGTFPGGSCVLAPNQQGVFPPVDSFGYELHYFEGDAAVGLHVFDVDLYNYDLTFDDSSFRPELFAELYFSLEP